MLINERRKTDRRPKIPRTGKNVGLGAALAIVFFLPTKPSQTGRTKSIRRRSRGSLPPLFLAIPLMPSAVNWLSARISSVCACMSATEGNALS